MYVDTSKERYNLIIQNIRIARKLENKKAEKLWKSKLEKWQKAYGAYAPNN